MSNDSSNKEFPPPRTYTQFVERFPQISQAWELIGEAGREGPLDERTIRLIKLALAMGAMSGGQTRSGVRKALAAGVSRDEIEQIVALAAGTVGLGSAAGLYQWVSEVITQPDAPRSGCC